MTDTYKRPPQRTPSSGCDVDPWYVEDAQAAGEWLRQQPRMTMAKAIRAKCLDCSGDTSPEIRRCQVFDCALWPFRLGCYPDTAEKRHPGVTDPTNVMLDGHRTGMRECGKRTWINPLTQKREPVAGEIDSE